MFSNMHAQSALSYREHHPTPPPANERVNLVCASCCCEFASRSTDWERNVLVYAIPENHSHYGNHPISKNFSSRLRHNGYIYGEYYTCPNGCKNAHNNKAVILDWCDEVDHLTPHQLWEFGDLLLKLDEVNKKKGEILSELQSYGYTE